MLAESIFTTSTDTFAGITPANTLSADTTGPALTVHADIAGLHCVPDGRKDYRGRRAQLLAVNVTSLTLTGSSCEHETRTGSVTDCCGRAPSDRLSESMCPSDTVAAVALQDTRLPCVRQKSASKTTQKTR